MGIRPHHQLRGALSELLVHRFHKIFNGDHSTIMPAGHLTIADFSEPPRCGK